MPIIKRPIFQLCPRLSSGGIERGTIDVSLKLKAEGYQPVVISGGGCLVDELSHANIEHIELPVYKKSPWHIINTSRALIRLIKQKQPALIHARSRAPIWVAYLAAKQTQIPLITSCHSPHGGGLLGLKHIYNRCITLGGYVIATSDFIKHYLVDTLHTPPNKIQVIHRGVDLARFNPHNISRFEIDKAIEQFNLPTNKRYICLAGRITRWKGQDVLLNALHQLNDPSLHAIIVGRIDSQSYFDSLTQLIAAHNLTRQVTFIPESTELPLIYALSDIALSTSRKPEAFGRVAVEAQAMGCITIATDLGAAKETVIHKKTGWLIEPDNPTALAVALRKALLLNKSDKEALTSAARTHVKEQFDQHQMLEKTLQLYSTFLSHYTQGNHDSPH